MFTSIYFTIHKNKITWNVTKCIDTMTKTTRQAHFLLKPHNLQHYIFSKYKGWQNPTLLHFSLLNAMFGRDRIRIIYRAVLLSMKPSFVKVTRTTNNQSGGDWKCNVRREKSNYFIKRTTRILECYFCTSFHEKNFLLFSIFLIYIYMFEKKMKKINNNIKFLI